MLQIKNFNEILFFFPSFIQTKMSYIILDVHAYAIRDANITVLGQVNPIPSLYQNIEPFPILISNPKRGEFLIPIPDLH